MRRLGLVTLLLFGPSCGGETEPSQAEHQALLQRMDAMEQRIDVLEQARDEAEPPEPLPPPGEVAVPVALDRAADPGPVESTLRVTVTTSGLRLDGKDITREDARRHFEEVARTQPGTRLVVLAEPEVAHATVVELLDMAREAGLRDVAMSARRHGE